MDRRGGVDLRLVLVVDLAVAPGRPRQDDPDVRHHGQVGVVAGAIGSYLCPDGYVNSVWPHRDGLIWPHRRDGDTLRWVRIDGEALSQWELALDEHDAAADC